MPLYVEPKSRDLEGLNRWIYDAWAHNVVPYLPDAVFELEDTLVFSAKSGKTIKTSGRRRFSNTMDPRPELNGGPLLIYKGKTDRPAILLDSSMGLTFEPFTLMCDKSSRSDGIACENATGYGNSGHVFYGTQVFDCNAAWRFGSYHHADCNNSDIVFYHPTIIGCTHALLILQDQALNFHLHSPAFLSTESAITAEKGGAVHIFGGSTYNVDWLFTQGDGGPNIMANSATGVRIDGGGLHRRQSGWLRTVPGKPAFMSTYHFSAISDVGIAADVNRLDQYLIDVVGGVNVLLSACTTQSKLASISGKGNICASVTADSCRLMGDLCKLMGKPAYFSMRNCFDGFGKPLADRSEKQE